MRNLIRAIFCSTFLLTPLLASASLDNGLAAYERGNYTVAFDIFSAHAIQGNANAQYHLGLLYAQGRGVPHNYGEALKWYRKAAEQGHANAQHNLGSLYDLGRGVPHNSREAWKWFRKAAEQGHANAQINVSVMEGAPEETVRAAVQGDAKAQNRLGLMYDKGRGVPQNYGEAAKWFRKAAEQGDVKAQIKLGFMYELGEGVPQNYGESLKWYRKAAEQGHTTAGYFLGLMYYQGNAVQQNYGEAAKWFRQSAVQGDASAQSILGLMYYYGEGVTKNPVMSYVLEILSSAQGNQKAIKARDLIRQTLSKAQIAEAQKMASAWRVGTPLPKYKDFRTVSK